MNSFTFIQTLTKLNQSRRLVLTQKMKRDPETGKVVKYLPVESVFEVDLTMVEELVAHKYSGVPIDPDGVVAKSGKKQPGPASGFNRPRKPK
jgi:hypothetical protein